MKDASKFTLVEANQLLRPYLQNLPFKRIQDQVGYESSRGVEINGVSWKLDLWAASVLMSANVDTAWKTFPILVRQSPGLNDPSIQGKPDKIWIDELLLAWPAGDTLLWFFQESTFCSVKDSE